MKTEIIFEKILKKKNVFGTQISFVTLWEIATKLKQNKESTPL